MLRLKMFILLNLILFGVISAAEPIFIPVKIDGPIHDPANHTYWYGPFCECASVLDVDGDGDLDIASGRNWYEAPDWIKHTDFRDGAATNGPETDDNSEFAMDVNFDGRMDIVSSGWMFIRGAFWYENPGKKGVVWKSTRIHMAQNMEGVIPGDIDGDGDEDILCNHWSLVQGQGMTWLEHIDREPWFVEHIIGTEADIHGNGLGDINMDGRMDIVTPSGWYEQPPRATDKSWTFHAEYQFQPPDGGRRASASHPILVYDANEDGLNDIIIGNSHAYGLAWLEQEIDSSGKRTFENHWIETDYSQFHTMELGDLNGDGKPELVTGKRLFAHHGDDIGAFEPLYAFWYDIQKGEFEKHILSFNHLPLYQDAFSHNPPPNYVVSVGMKLNIADMDKDGRNDVVIAGKGGLYVFYNKGEPPTPRNAYQLPPENTYPTWREWSRYDVLFNSKDFTGWKVPQGDNGHWKVVNGVIDYDAMSEAEGNKNLFTEESFGDFALHMEWRLKETHGLYPMRIILPDGSYKKDADGNVITIPTPNADSGILLRGASQQVNIWCWPAGSGELWSVRNNENLSPVQRAAAVPKTRADKPVGQWNSFDITLIGDRITIMLNGITVIENAQIPGLPERGPIGLQHHGGWNEETGEYSSASSLIQFRNILINRLDEERPRRPVPIQRGRNSAAPAPQMDSEGFITLFDGSNLDNWNMGPDKSWVVEDGVITLKREEFDSQEHNADYLWTKDIYGDFILELEFRVPERANSGIFFRTSDLKDPVYTGIEMQVSNSYGRDALNRRSTAGAIYEFIAPSKNPIKKPGEWNQCRIMCDDNKILVWLNGEQIIDMDVNQWTEPNRNPDGSKNKFPTALKDFAREGYIGLQDHGRPVWYRNIKIRPLK